MRLEPIGYIYLYSIILCQVLAVNGFFSCHEKFFLIFFAQDPVFCPVYGLQSLIFQRLQDFSLFAIKMLDRWVTPMI